ncbi:MAG TPA: S9 family peptidase [Acidimicrobiaceae bacterium]|nr:S9 family peptidase [Acidimicrobiaceae bacterium]
MADTPIAPPPATRRGEEADVYHGVTVPDPYRWLEDGSSPDTQEWVAAHYQRTRSALDARPSWGWWHERLSALTGLPTTLALQVAGPYLFTLERPAGADQYVLAVRSITDPAAAPRTLVDPATMAADAAVAIDWYHPSADGSHVAYGLSEGGTENSVLHVMQVGEGAGTDTVLPLRIANTRAASVAWLPDNSGFWYARYPEGDEYHRHIRFHRLGTDPADDPVVFDRLVNPETWPDVSARRDGRYLLVHALVGWSRVDVHLLDTASGEWTVVVEGVDAQTSFRFDGDSIVGITTRDALNGRVVRASLSSPSDWATVVPERPDTVLTGVVMEGDDLIVSASRVAVDHLERYAPDGALLATIDLGVAAVVALDSDAGRTFVARGTFGAPVHVARLAADNTLQPWGEPIDPAVLPELTVRQVFYPSLDGTEIPMFVAHRADVAPSPETPLILTGYGGFAIAYSPAWLPNLAAWCAAGGVYAIAGLRGGYEYGEAWHQAGRRAHKQRVFDDFHAAADWLVAEGYTSRNRLAIHGGSNGGLLMGATITQRPELAPAVWCGVPLLDMIRFPQFLIARLWTDEYGDPDVEEEFAWLHAYSPYHRVVEGGRYPAVLFTTAEGDTRVDPCHARKMAALLTHASASQAERPILLLQEGRAGHGVGKPASMKVKEGADVLAFFTWQLGLEADGWPA